MKSLVLGHAARRVNPHWLVSEFSCAVWLQQVGSCQGHSRKQTAWSSGLVRQNLVREPFTRVWAGSQETLLKGKMMPPGLATDKSHLHSYIQRDRAEERRGNN